MFNYFNYFPMSDNVIKCREYAHQIAVKNRNKYIEPIHLLYAMYNIECMGSELLHQAGLSPVNIVAEMGRLEKTDSLDEPAESDAFKMLFDDARKIAITSKRDCIYTEHLLLAFVLFDDSPLIGFLSKNIDVSQMIRDMAPHMDINSIYNNINNMQQSYSASNAKQNRGTSTLPSEIGDLGVDFTQRAKEGKIDPVIGRKNEIERIIEILCRKTKNNPVLIGEPGVGKSAVVEGLAREIVEGNVPELLKNKIIFSLDIGSLMAGTKYRGELEQRLKTAIEAIMKRGDIIVFIDELHTLAQAGGKEGEVTPADMLKPYLARGELQTIGATTTDEYRKFIETDKALERRFQPIMVDPPSVEETIEILKGIRPNYEKFHNVKISDEAISAAAQLSDRYISDRFLPDKAIDLIDEAASRAKVNGNKLPPEIKEMEEQLKEYQEQINKVSKGEDFILADKIKKQRDSLADEINAKKAAWQTNGGLSIGAEEIAEVVSKWTKIPVTRLNETEVERLNNLEKILHERVVGQDKAVESVSKAIRRARAGLKDPKRPIGSFLFLGPTGVGKTELTKALAAAMFDDENNIIRFDMSEYMEAHSVSKLIGSPPGYVGFDDGGQLTEQVRRKPYSVVLFDEIEKAHSDVYNLLLQVFDEGRLTDSQGRTVDFKNTIIIMTSNVGVSELKTRRAIGFNDNKENAEQQDEERILSDALKRHFRPEFLNRIDVICYFKHLTEENIKAIADIMMRKVTKKLDDRHIKLQYTPSIINYVIKYGYDPEYGARPLRRIIEQTIEDCIADALIGGKLKDNSTATIDYADGKVIIR